MTLSRHQALAVLRAGAALLLVARASPSRASPRRDRRIRVVVVGAGFGGLSAASCLAAHPGIDLTVIDRTDHHRFQPLLYQVATAALSPSDIAAAVPAILPAGPGVRILQATVTGIDTAGRSVLCDGLSVPYDELILSTGSRPSCFGHGSRAAAAPGLKTLDDAPALRSTILGAFDRARLATGIEQETLPTFVLIGGGPTGVEMAGSIAELANDRLRRGHAATAPRARIIRVSTIVWTVNQR
jgi:NADH dehydrogenase